VLKLKAKFIQASTDDAVADVLFPRVKRAVKKPATPA